MSSCSPLRPLHFVTRLQGRFVVALAYGLFLLCTMRPGVAQVAAVHPSDPLTFSGTYGTGGTFLLTLLRTGNAVKGTYRFDEDKTDYPLEGKLSDDGSFEAIETQNGNLYGRFTGQLIGPRLRGHWLAIGSEPKSLDLSLIGTSKAVQASPASAPKDAMASPIADIQSSKPMSGGSFPESNVQTSEPISNHGQERVALSHAIAQDRLSLAPPQGEGRRSESVGTDGMSLLQIGVAVWLAVAIVGVFLGFSQKIVVFRNYNDLAIVFAVGACLLAFVFSLFLVAHHPGWIYASVVVAALCIGLVLWIVARTFVDNPNPFLLIIAFTTKLTLSVLFLFNLVAFIAPSGKTAAQRASSRRTSLIALILIAPITLALVRDKNGIFSPRALLGYRF